MSENIILQYGKKYSWNYFCNAIIEISLKYDVLYIILWTFIFLFLSYQILLSMCVI